MKSDIGVSAVEYHDVWYLNDWTKKIHIWFVLAGTKFKNVQNPLQAFLWKEKCIISAKFYQVIYHHAVFNQSDWATYEANHVGNYRLDLCILSVTNILRALKIEFLTHFYKRIETKFGVPVYTCKSIIFINHFNRCIPEMRNCLGQYRNKTRNYTSERWILAK